MTARTGRTANPSGTDLDTIPPVAETERAQLRRAAAVVLERVPDQAAARDIICALMQPARPVRGITAGPRPATPKPGQTDAAPVRERVAGLVNAGMSQRAVARAADVSPAAVSQLLHGLFTPGRPTQTTVTEDMADRLMRVTFTTPAPGEEAVEICPRVEGFTVVGHRVGRCAACGQLAPVWVNRNGGEQLVRHPVPDNEEA